MPKRSGLKTLDFTFTEQNWGKGELRVIVVEA